MGNIEIMDYYNMPVIQITKKLFHEHGIDVYEFKHMLDNWLNSRCFAREKFNLMRLNNINHSVQEMKCILWFKND